MRLINFIRFALAIGVLTAAVAYSHTSTGTFTVFGPGVLNRNQFNDTLAHIHDTFAGNIKNVHISASAAIVHTKLAQPNLIPKAVAQVTATCNAGTSTTCLLLNLGNVNLVKGAGTTGVYNVTLSYTPISSNFPVLVTSHLSAVLCIASGFSTSAPHFTVRCHDSTTGTPADSFFSIAAYGS